MQVIVYGRANCKLCIKAMEKLDLLGVAYTKEDIDYYINLHDGWRTDGSLDIMTGYCMNDTHLPVLKIDGQFYGAPVAMGVLKEKLGMR